VRKKSIASDAGFTTFTTGIRAGWQRELASRKFRQAVAAELVATAIFVAIGSLSVITTFNANEQDSGTGSMFVYNAIRNVGIAFTFGLLICVLVFSTGSISGGNINPAVTLSLLITRKMSALRAVGYILAQCAGACLGAGFAKSLLPDLYTTAGGAANMVNFESLNLPGVTMWTAVGGEMLGTALLVFTVCAAADVGREKSNKYTGALTPLMIGLAVLSAHLFLIPVDGCSINPARSFGSAVVYGGDAWKNHWVVSECSGALPRVGAGGSGGGAGCARCSIGLRLRLVCRILTRRTPPPPAVPRSSGWAR
jgi:aquaporin PIP